MFSARRLKIHSDEERPYVTFVLVLSINGDEWWQTGWRYYYKSDHLRGPMYRVGTHYRPGSGLQGKLLEQAKMAVKSTLMMKLLGQKLGTRLPTQTEVSEFLLNLPETFVVLPTSTHQEDSSSGIDQ